MTAKVEAESATRRFKVRFLIESLVVALVITGVVVLLEQTKVIDFIEKLLDDVAVAYTTPNVPKAHPGVAVVAIDDETINGLPWRSPIPRKFLARLLRVIDKGKPAAIGVDVLFFEPSHDPSDDEELANALASFETPVVLATELLEDGSRALIPILEKIGAERALANLPVDLIDRTFRKFKTAFADDKGVLHDTIATALARHAGAEVVSDASTRPIDWYGRPGWQDRRIAGAENRFAGPRPIATYPATTLIKVPVLASGWLKDKVVLVGATFSGSHDFLRTPFEHLGVGEESFAGVYGHAQVVAQLLDGRSRLSLPRYSQTLLVLFSVIFGMALALLRVPAVVPVVCGLLLPIFWILGVFYVRQQTGLVVPALPPALGAGLSLTTFALLRARRFDHAQRIAARALNSYLPPALARRVVANPDLLQLGGEPRELSILFTDIVNFTSYSEHSEPGDVVKLLNLYLDSMAEIVLAHDGTLDKFIGDAVMAFFGAPVAVANHSALALACALKMDQFAREFSKEHGLATRIGVHTGNVIVGNIGGERRFDYTVIGDAVNTAARLESANKFLRVDGLPVTSICISGNTVDHFRGLVGAGDHPGVPPINFTSQEMRARPGAPTLRRVGKIRVKGRTQPLDVYTTTPPGFAPDDLDSYHQALELLEAERHDDARIIFENLYNDDQMSAYQLARCVNRDEPILTLTEK